LELTLYTEEYFNSAHLLKGYEGKCARMHGHTWKICVWVKGSDKERDNVGILWDFNNLGKIINDFDHQFLNDVINNNPSVENLALYVYETLKKNHKKLKFKIRIYESIIKKESYCETGDF